TSRDEAAGTNTGTGEDRRRHADQHAVADLTAVDEGLVSDGDIRAEDAGGVVVRVQDGAVLDICAFPDAARADVPAYDAAVGEGGIGADVDVPDDGRAGGDIGRLVDAWAHTLEGQDQWCGAHGSHFAHFRACGWP